jgi:hypothetical protein
MKFVTLITPILAFFLLSGCVEDLTADDTRAFLVLARGETAQTDDKRIQVISSQNSFDDVHYRILNRSGSAATINFDQFQVLLVMTGAGYTMRQLDVDAFVGSEKQVKIMLNTVYAGDSCTVPAVVRQPWMLVLFPKVSKPLQVQEQVTVTEC